MRNQIEMFVAAEKVFADPRLADYWVARPNRRLGGRTPAELAGTASGIESILAELQHLANSRRRTRRRG